MDISNGSSQWSTNFFEKRSRDTITQTVTVIVSKDHQLPIDLLKPITKKTEKRKYRVGQKKKTPLKFKALFFNEN